MSQVPTKSASPSAGGSPPLAAGLHRQGGQWRLAIVANRTGKTLVEARTVTSAAEVLTLLAQHKVERLVRVAPAKETVARCVPVPPGGSDELAGAVSLLAEAQLPESIPAHRRGAGVVSNNGHGRAALLVGWQGEAPDAISDEIEETWTTPAAALSALRAGQASGAIYADAQEGAISILAFGTSKAVARVLVEEAPTQSGFARVVAGVMSETCSAAGAQPPHFAINSSGVILSMDPGAMTAASAAISGVPDQRQWFEQYGIALGAAVLGLSKDPLERPLGQMKSAAPVKRESVPERVAGWLSRPRNAWSLLGAAAVVVLVGPLVIATARLSVLEAKAVGLGDKNRERAETARRTAMYKQLEISRWPMTKLLADISGAIPVGVTTESIRLATDQGLAIQGSAESPELVNTMQANLNGTKLLANVKLNRVESSGTGVEFDLSADVVNPHVKAAGVEDFAKKSLAERLYGEGASNTATPVNKGGRESTHESRPAPRATAERSDRGGDRTERGSDRPERSGSRASEEPKRPSGSTASSTEPPPPLTDDQIKKMDKPTATSEWVKRKTFPQKNPTTDAATKSRLDEEVRKLREQMDKAGGAK